MSSSTALMPASQTQLPAPAQAQPASPHVDAYRLAHRALRGRYFIAIVLALICGAVGAFLGWSKGVAIYRSEGLVRIAYEQPSLMQDRQEYSVPVEIFQAFLQTQQALIGSRKILDQALETPTWRATGLGKSPAVLSRFAENLKTEYKLNTDYLRVSFTDPDPAVAAAAVKSVITAYTTSFSSQDNGFQQQKLQALEQRREQLDAQLKELRAREATIVTESGSADVDRLHDAAVMAVTKLEAMLTDVRLAMVLAQGQNGVSFTVEQMAMFDPVLRGYLADRERAQDVLDQLRLRGAGDEHPQVVAAQKAVQIANERIAKQAQQFQSMQTRTVRPRGTDEGAMALAAQPLESLRMQEQGISKLLVDAKRDMAELGARKLQLGTIRSESATIQKDLEEVTNRRDMLRVEALVGGRLNVISSGETPIAPFQDRRIPMAAVGGLAGGALPIGLFLVLGLVSNRYRYSDEMQQDHSSDTPLLGILPLLPDGLNDPERAADAAQCVHHIRAMLQIGHQGRKPVFLVSSASPGEGKTSLVAALGMSFAASGSRTLIIDCDVVGQNMSVAFQGDKQTGLCEALQSGILNGYVKKTETKGLWLLPVGQNNVMHASALSWSSVQRLLDDARRNFDVVVIDSGPILGSVEAQLVAPQVDGVIFTIARGQQRPLVDRAIRQLKSTGAKLAGLVFNRAEPRDFYHSVQKTSLRSVSAHDIVRPLAVCAVEEESRFGPVVRSVASFTPPSPAVQATRS